MTEVTEAMWLVYSREHNAWWRANRSGYTVNIEEAGRYGHDEAQSLCRCRDPQPDRSVSEFAVPAPEAALTAKAAVHIVDAPDPDHPSRPPAGMYDAAPKPSAEQDDTELIQAYMREGKPIPPGHYKVSGDMLTGGLEGSGMDKTITEVDTPSAEREVIDAAMAQLSDIDHEWFGSWLDAGPSCYDQYQTDTARLAHVLHCIHGYREAVRALTSNDGA